MAGGIGSRFWPYSRKSKPKQFLDFFGTGHTLLQQTFDRYSQIVSPENIIVMENGKERTLRTLGDKWSYLQRVKFGANAQPFYVLIDNEGNPLNKSYSFDEDVNKYIDFLETGLKNYNK